MKVLILGSGGREHTLAWKISQSPLLSGLYIAPGNAGTAAFGENIAISPNDFPAIKQFVTANNIGMVIPGPEDPLVKGIRDFFLADQDLKDVMLIGPSASAAMLEGSKDFAKDFMFRKQIPTAPYKSFSLETINEAYNFLGIIKPPYVLKADGLAAGKGVLITSNISEAKEMLAEMLSGEMFGRAGSKVVIEEFLKGIEVSVFVLSDGENYVVLPEAKDYKRIGENDTGANTGGMGAVSPVAFADDVFMAKVKQQIIEPTLKGMKNDGKAFTGFLFIGLMNVGGNPYVIEYNVRLGDPETEVVLPRIENDFLELLIATAKGQLQNTTLSVSEKSAVTIIAVSKGYPASYKKGKAIQVGRLHPDTLLFHAGTLFKDGETLTNGGRVLALTSLADNLEDALLKSYESIKEVDFEGITYRRDIGKDLLSSDFSA